MSAISNTAKTLLIYIFEWNPLEHGLTLYAVINIVLLLLFAIAFVVVIVKKKLYKNIEAFVYFILCTVASPFFACMWFFISDKVEYRPMMLIFLCFVPIFSALIAEKYFSLKFKNIVAVILAVFCLNSINNANIAYNYMNRTFYNSFATASEMVSRIHQLDYDDTQLCVVGDLQSEVSLDDISNADKLHLYLTLLETNLLIDKYHVVEYINNYFYCDFERTEEQWELEENRKAEIDKMDVWPASDSMKIVDGVMVIKLAEAE